MKWPAAAALIGAVLLHGGPLRASPCFEIEQPEQIRAWFEARQFWKIEEHSPAASAPSGFYLYRGLVRIKRGRYREAYADLERAYELAPQDANTLYQLGMAELRGYGGKAEKERGYQRLRQASGRGCAEARYALAVRELQSSQYASAPAIQALLKLSDAGHADAAFVLAQMFARGSGVEQDLSTALKHFRRAAEQGNAIAQFELARALGSDWSPVRDMEEAEAWLAQSIAQGEPRAFWLQGLDLVRQGKPRQAHHAYWRAAAGGFTSGQINLAVGYLHGVGVPQSYSRAAHWLYRASGAPLAQYYLGDLHVLGRGVEQDVARAYEFYSQAAAVMPSAKAVQAALLSQGIGVTADPDRARKLERIVDDLVAQNATGTLLNTLAWVYATHPLEEVRQPVKGLQLAERAYQLQPDAAHADTLAAAYAAVGRFSDARRYAEIALKDVTDPLTIAGTEQRLKGYALNEPWIENYAHATAAADSESVHGDDMHARGKGDQDAEEVAVFTGEFVAVFQRTRNSPPGFDVEAAANFGVVVLVGETERGRLPHFMQDIAHFYIHSPTQYFHGIEPKPGFLQPPDGLFRFRLVETGEPWWSHALNFEPLTSSPDGN